MEAHAQREVAAHRGAPSLTGRVRARAALLVENLGIAASYLLLCWVGHRLRLDGDVIVFWPAAGFALAVLLVRGGRRWPGILLGSFAASYLVLGTGIFQTAQSRTGPEALLTAGLVSAARTLATLAGAWLVQRLTGTRRWPHSTRGVTVFALVAAVVYPALAALPTQIPQALLWPSQATVARLGFWQEAWLWFVANSSGSLVVAPLLLALREPPVGRPRRSRVEVGLAALAFVLSAAVCLGLAGADVTIPLAYPLTPLMLWCVVRFGSRGAVLSNALWAAVLVSSALHRPGDPLTQVFSELHARLAVLGTVVLALAAAFEERQQLQRSLEAERRSLEARVAERTRELAHYLSLLHSSLESTADGLLVVDLQGHIVVTNQRFSELWRIPSEVLESGADGRALAYVLDQLASPERFMERVHYLYAHPELESEEEFSLKDGRIFERFSRPQRLGTEVVGRVWSFRDVTLRRRTEAERNRLLVEESRARQDAERAVHEAQRALALRDDFLQVAAHEMKTPVTSMKLQLQHLARLLSGESRSAPDPQRLRAGIAAVLRPMRRFEELSDQLLDVKRLDGGEAAPTYEALDLEEAVRRELEDHREAAARAGSELRLDCSGPIPAECDPKHLEQILCNLLSNAIKFGAGSPLTVRLDAGADRVLLQVSDQGIGIAPEDHERILGRFERAVDSRHYGGLGLGLWLVRQSTEALGGALSIQSELGQGATFRVMLPRWRPGARSPVELPAAEAQPG